MSTTIRLSSAIAMATGLLLCASGAAAHGPTAQNVPDFEDPRPLNPAPPAEGAFDPSAVEGVIDQVRLWQAGTRLVACFMGGSQEQRRFVAGAAAPIFVGINLSVDFGAEPELRTCDGVRLEHVRIAFDPAKGNNSYIGTDSIRIDLKQPSMNLSDIGIAAPGTLESDQNRGVVLHEFGHAVALLHEHQLPDARCDAEFAWDAIYAQFSRSGWSRPKVDANIRSLKDLPRLRTTPYDRLSIMHYYFAPWMYTNGEQSSCYVGHNTTLSAGDIAILKSSYPATGAGQVAEINKRAVFMKSVLARLGVTTPAQKEWALDQMEQVAATAAPNAQFNFRSSSETNNTGTCAGATITTTAGDNAVIAPCIEAGNDVNIGVPKPARQ